MSSFIASLKCSLKSPPEPDAGELLSETRQLPGNREEECHVAFFIRLGGEGKEGGQMSCPEEGGYSESGSR
jgi:hypothetical protein